MINLKLSYKYGKYESKYVNLIDSEPLIINIVDSKKLANVEYFAIIDCGNAHEVQRIENNKITLDYKFTCKTDKINITIQAKAQDGTTVYEYVCEDLLVTVIDEDRSVIPEITSLNNRVERAEKALTELYKIIKSRGDLGL